MQDFDYMLHSRDYHKIRAIRQRAASKGEPLPNFPDKPMFTGLKVDRSLQKPQGVTPAHHNLASWDENPPAPVEITAADARR